ncbi:MAG TPA: hypothetical protein VK111_10845 [Virgibacillus sp.]|nr:hypothetical protein [Virgibacillus sp.]
MNINYLNDGDILYKKETYKYRYKAIHEVEIEVLTMIHNSGRGSTSEAVTRCKVM